MVWKGAQALLRWPLPSPLVSTLPEATLLLCVYCYSFCSPVSRPEEPQTGMQGAADRPGADQREVVN